MKAGKGKAKGSAFERQICKDLSLWITKGARDDCLWRSAMSGGRATVSGRKGKGIAHAAGDICAIHPDGHRLINDYFVECKSYKDLKYSQLVTSNKGPVVDFWEQARLQARENKKLPMLILKQNLLPTLLGVGIWSLTKLSLETYGTHPLIVIPTIDLYLFDYQKLIMQVPYPYNPTRRRVL